MDDRENNMLTLPQKAQKKEKLFVQHVQNLDFGWEILLPDIYVPSQQNFFFL